MNIEELTIAQFREIAAIVGGGSNVKSAFTDHIGEKCIIRTYASGVHFGTLTQRDGRAVELVNARRIWRFDVKSHGISLSEVANHGPTDSRTRICETVPTMTILDALEIIPCSKIAVKVIEAEPIAEPS